MVGSYTFAHSLVVGLAVSLSALFICNINFVLCWFAVFMCIRTYYYHHSYHRSTYACINSAELIPPKNMCRFHKVVFVLYQNNSCRKVICIIASFHEEHVTFIPWQTETGCQSCTQDKVETCRNEIMGKLPYIM